MGTIPQISRWAAQWRPSFRSRSRKGRLCPWTRGRLPHVLRQFLGFGLVPRYEIKDIVIKSAANHYHTGILVYV